MDFRLSDEQQEWQQYCRKFAREVIRPVAAKYDREQSVPWDVIREARKWDLHGLDYIQKMGADPDGMFGVIYAEEMHWGCAGIALAISASVARRRGHRLVRHAGADRPVDPRVLRHRRRDQDRRLRRHRGGRGLRRQVAPHHRQARRRRVGPERHQGLHLERRHRRRHRRRRHRRPRARPPRPGLVRRGEGHARPVDGQEGGQDRHPRVADRARSCSRTAGSRWSTSSAAWTS